MTKHRSPPRWRILVAVLAGAAVVYGLTLLVGFLWAAACTGSAPDLPGCDSLVQGGRGAVEGWVPAFTLLPALVFLLGSIPTLRTGRRRPALTAFAVVMGLLAAIGLLLIT